ncbi:MAG: hypothetical protein CM15mP64_3010 [Candidatus Neomarinimicrobiota bacterium]|nr:MAG: hypothetical protein CM15mP64_3010 [Candidatus Neomarinimicrobiota bacterium]
MAKPIIYFFRKCNSDIFFLSFIILFNLTNAADSYESDIQKSNITFIGTRFNIIQNGDTPNRYIWLHGDEQTARMALEYHIDRFGGIAFFIESKTREIPFESTMIDPNRIFSRKGTYHALRKFKPDWQPGTLKKALDIIDAERDAFLDILMPSKSGVLISVHNNFRGYNVHMEKDKSQRVSIKSDQNPRDFIICTDSNDYDSLSDGPFNIVLQNIFPDDDDGSLSWEALRRGVRYLNIETRLGYLTQQKKMLSFVESNLD